VTKTFAAIICSAAVALLAATGAQACGNPGDQLLADSVLARTDTSAQQVAPKDQRTTEQGGKTEQGGR
jgi:hypothetical protein